MFSFKRLIDEAKRPLVMGILNVTPDSFSDGGEAFNIDDVIEKVNTMCYEGADIIDVGACSTAPQNKIIGEAEELERLKKFLPSIIKASRVPVSLDTLRPAVAEYGLSVGVSVINDESGSFEPAMAELVKKYSCGWIFMHTGGLSSGEVGQYHSGVVKDVTDFFENMKRSAVSYGLNAEQLAFDCGIGFGKARQDDLTLLNSCEELSQYSPLLVGVSRKRIIGEITGAENPKERLWGSVGAALVVASKGAKILRVHDVKATVDALKVSEAIKRGVL
ncbi:MAG: dihydropteroate synthase [Clostridia bacterium]|nr:dihydropteroate synthase [Clostridia bacterium]